MPYKNSSRQHLNLLVCMLSSLLLLSGCVSSRIEQTRHAATGILPDETMVLLGRASYNDKQTEPSYTACVAHEISRGANPILVMGQAEFKDRMYPWFEARTAPSSAAELSHIFAQPGAQEKMAEARVRYLVWIDGDTITIKSGGSMSCTVSTVGAGCLGMSYWEEDASYEASIWDVESMIETGQISAEATGTSYLAGLIIPIPILARPGKVSCKKLAHQLRDFITGDQ